MCFHWYYIHVYEALCGGEAQGDTGGGVSNVAGNTHGWEDDLGVGLRGHGASDVKGATAKPADSAGRGSLQQPN